MISHIHFYDETAHTIKKKSHTRNLLSDGNDRMLGFLLKAGNWKIPWMKPDKIAKFMHAVQFGLGISRNITQEIKFTSNPMKLYH